MARFSIGQEIICIDDDWFIGIDPHTAHECGPAIVPKRFSCYHVHGYNRDRVNSKGVPFLYVREIPEWQTTRSGVRAQFSFVENQFAPIEKWDISAFKKMEIKPVGPKVLEPIDTFGRPIPVVR